MAADEDIELRDLLLEALEKRGVISRIKAELRASVYLALEEQQPPRTGPAGSPPGEEAERLAASLVHDFLRASGLRFTLSVLEPELHALLATAEPPLGRQELSGRLCLDAQQRGPLLLQLLPPSPQADQEAGDRRVDSQGGQEAPAGVPPAARRTCSTAPERPSGSEGESVPEQELPPPHLLDDSSLSTSADDRTGDQSLSRCSELDGCDYAEPAAP